MDEVKRKLDELENITSDDDMKIKEAIERIKEHKVHFINEPRAIKITKALDMAIEVLEELELVEDEFDHPIKDLFSVSVLLCMALNLKDHGCKNCPVTLFDYDKRTKYEKCCLHEPCQTNLYKWIIEQAMQK